MLAQQDPLLQTQAPPVEPSAPPPIQLSASDEMASRMPDPAQGLVHLDVTVTDRYGW